MRLGYNTNGLANHEPIEAIDLLADIGYQSIAITIDHLWMSPKSADRFAQMKAIQNRLDHHQLGNVIETGARFLLDPRTKHFPTLLEVDDDQAAVRINFLKYCIDVGSDLGSDCVSIWSGIKPQNSSYQEAMDRLVKRLEPVVKHAEDRKIVIGFEPEPGMLIDTTGRFERLLHLFDSPRLRMTMDLGHLFCLNEVPMAGYIEKWADRIVNIHIEDMRTGIHEHLMFGEGQIHFPPVIETLVGIDYQDALHVELSRHSHNAANIARQSYEFLKPIIDDAESSRGFSL